MADMGELKNMIMSFRVSELQVLLGFAGRNKSGRKQELLQRAIQLVQKGCSTAIQIKIRELYRRRYPGKVAGAAHASSHNTHPQASAMSKRPMHKSSRPVDGSHDYKFSPLGGTAPAPASSASYHHNSIPVHPDVKLKRLPFYDVLGELLKTSSLVSRGSSRFQETFFVFHLTPQQAQDIALSRDMRPGARIEYGVQIQLRFCLLETSCEQEDAFPPSICVRINGKMAPLPNPIPTNKPGVEPKRPSRPVNITTICRISPTIPNHINISWASELGRSYCVTVVLVRRLNSDLLLQRLKQNGVRHPDHTRALIKEKLAHDPDSEIATTSLRVSLNCPLGKMRMTIPSRASTCNHLQTFDAPTFLQMNEKKPTWTCPVCDKCAEFDKLSVDGLFTEILREAPDATEIKFIEDGSWRPMSNKDKEEEAKNSFSVHDITIGGDSPHKSSSSKAEAKKEADVIDLTCSDDEDDMPMTSIMDSSLESDSDDNQENDRVVSLSTSSSSSSSTIMGSPRTPPALTASRTPPALTSPSASMPRDSSTVSLSSSGCVSPAAINLDMPPHSSITHTPPSLPRTPQPPSLPRTPQPLTPMLSRSPYATSPAHLSPHLLSQPPPAHSTFTQTPPPPYLSNSEPVSEFDEFLNIMTNMSRGISGHPYGYPAPPMYNYPYSMGMAMSSHSSLHTPENLSTRDRRETTYSTGS